MSVNDANDVNEDVNKNLLPIVEHLSNSISLQDFELICSHYMAFFSLLEMNVYIPVLCLPINEREKNWIQLRMYECKPPYKAFLGDVGDTNDSKYKTSKISTICLSSLIANYPPQRAIVLFDSMARVNGKSSHPIFQSIAGNCVIIPTQIKKWPLWDHDNFPWLFPPPQ